MSKRCSSRGSLGYRIVELPVYFLYLGEQSSVQLVKDSVQMFTIWSESAETASAAPTFVSRDQSPPPPDPATLPWPMLGANIGCADISRLRRLSTAPQAREGEHTRFRAQVFQRSGGTVGQAGARGEVQERHPERSG